MKNNGGGISTKANIKTDLPSLPLLAEDLPLFRVLEKTFRYSAML